MGAADVIPGVSGGTIAFITGIYSELVKSLSLLNIQSLRVLMRSGFSKFWSTINGNFLLVLFSGILVSVFSLARLLEYLLMQYPIVVWSFFFGLVLISGILVLRRISNWSGSRIIALLSGVVTMVLITRFSPVETPESYWFIFISGAIAICAMILPGISGAFILLILGKYQFIIRAVSNFDIPVIIVFGVGAVFGLLSFSNLLSWLFRKYHDITIALLSGFILGSLNKIWPWKETISSALNSHGESIPVVQRNISPIIYSEITGNDHMILYATLFALCGVLVVVLLELLSKKER
jgi:putative membrane protein